MPYPIAAIRPKASGNVITYALRDDFTTAEAAPIASPRTCEPGPGSLTTVNTVTNGAISISDGKLVMARPTGGGSYTGYGGYAATGYARKTGRAVYVLNASSSIVSNVVPIAVNSSAALNQFGKAKIHWQATNSIQILSGVGSALTVGTSLSAGTAYHCALIERSSGWVFLMKGGVQYPSWTPLYVSALGTDATLYPYFANLDSQYQLGEMGIFDLSGNLATDYGWCTYYDATPTANDTGTGVADGWDYFTWTPAAAETLSLYFRRTDDDNTYRLDCAQAGGTIKLYRRESASDTELGAGKTQTWTAGTAYRIGIRHMAGAIITTVETSAGGTAKHSVTGETYNLAVTGIKCAGFAAGANWEVYPGTLQGTGITDLSP